MNREKTIQNVLTELETGMALTKCRQCGCMESTLDNLDALLSTIDTGNLDTLGESVSASLSQLRPVRYACLGCDYCYPAVAQAAFSRAFPAYDADLAGLSCDFQVDAASWPPVVGEYAVLDETASVAVSTLASVHLVDELAALKPAGLAIVGKTETENIGIDKVIKNVISSSTIRYLILAGREPAGHLTGNTLLALAENGVDDERRVIGSRGKCPLLRNVAAGEIHAFREQVQLIDLIGCESPDEIAAQVEALSRQTATSCGCNGCGDQPAISISTAPAIIPAEPADPVRLDKAGYFVIVPLADRGVINVEHYAYDNTLLRTIEGKTARAIYRTIVDQGWVTELSHAAYLGKELAKAELSLELGFNYVQDGA